MGAHTGHAPLDLLMYHQKLGCQANGGRAPGAPPRSANGYVTEACVMGSVTGRYTSPSRSQAHPQTRGTP